MRGERVLGITEIWGKAKKSKCTQVRYAGFSVVGWVSCVFWGVFGVVGANFGLCVYCVVVFGMRIRGDILVLCAFRVVGGVLCLLLRLKFLVGRFLGVGERRDDVFFNFFRNPLLEIKKLVNLGSLHK